MSNYFATNITFLREKLGKNQGEFGKLFGKSANCISSWETGARQPIVVDMVMVSNYFSISINDLLFTDLRFNNEPLAYANDETELIDVFRKLSPDQRKLAIRLIKNIGE